MLQVFRAQLSVKRVVTFMLARQLRDNAPGLLRGESFKNH